MDNEELVQLRLSARAHRAERDLLTALREPEPLGAVVTHLLQAQQAHADLRAADGGSEEAHQPPAVGLEMN